MEPTESLFSLRFPTASKLIECDYEGDEDDPRFHKVVLNDTLDTYEASFLDRQRVADILEQAKLACRIAGRTDMVGLLVDIEEQLNKQ